jgi:hypothetical protein
MIGNEDQYQRTQQLRREFAEKVKQSANRTDQASVMIRAALGSQIETFDDELRRYEAGERPAAEEDDASVPILQPLPAHRPAARSVT